MVHFWNSHLSDWFIFTSFLQIKVCCCSMFYQNISLAADIDEECTPEGTKMKGEDFLILIY